MNEELDGKKSVSNAENNIKAFLTKSGAFYLVEGQKFEPLDNIKDSREEQVQILAANNKFEDSDYFLLSTINNIGYATVPMILRKLAMEKRLSPSLDIPLYNVRTLKTKLNFFVKYGLLYGFSYNKENNDKHVIMYVCSQLGWQLAKTHLMSTGMYDKFALYRSTGDMLKRLAANTVAFAYAANIHCSAMNINESITYGTKEKINVMAHVSYLEDDEVHYIIESVFFNIDEKIATQEQNIESIDERLSQLQKLAEFQAEKNGWNTKIIFVVENLSGLKTLASVLKTKDMAFFLEHAMFTSENIVINTNYDLTSAFLKIKSEGDKYSFVLAM